MAIALSDTLPAPATIVFDHLRDLNKVQLWVKEVEKAYFTHEPIDTAIGTTFVQHIRQGLQLNAYACEVREYAQDEWLQVRMTGDSLIMEVDYRLRELAEGCQIDWRTEVKPRGFFGTVMGMVFQGFSEPVLRRQLRELKRVTTRAWQEAPAS